MQRYADDRAIMRKAKLGKILMFGGLGLMAAILFYSFKNPGMSNLFFIIALVGMLLSQMGIMLSNRWGKSPRVDEVIDQALKGLDSKYAIFHYDLGASHVLFSPSGVFTLVPSALAGEITYEDGKWWQTQLRRGRPRRKVIKTLEVDAEVDIRSLTKTLRRFFTDRELPPVSAIIVFLHQDANVKTENAPLQAIHIKKLKSWLRKNRGLTFSEDEVARLAEWRGL
jgi:hypothetical protein